MGKMKLVCVGNGMVGQRFLEQLTSRMSSDALDVTVFCEEPRAAYDRVSSRASSQANPRSICP